MTKLANAPRLDDLYKMVAYTYSDKNIESLGRSDLRPFRRGMRDVDHP